MGQALVDGISLHYRIVGHGPPLVLIHGLACGRRMWVRQIQELSRRFTVIAYDQRGHGRSDAPNDPSCYSPGHLARDLVGLLDRLGIGEVRVVGFSLGAGPALALAANQPSRLLALVLADAGAGAENPWRSQWLARRWISMARASPDELYDDMLRHEFFKSYAGRSQRARRHMRALIAATPLDGLCHTLSEVVAKRLSLYRQTRLLNSIQAPTLVLRGGRDYVCLRSSRLLADAIPGAVRCEIADAGHMTPLEQPRSFNQAVADFFERVAARSR